jgi:L-seryl-tRNA(Ser) seleniumtransferase
MRFGHNNGAPVYVDDAGGARVGPAAFGNPRTLELDATGFDKYGPKAPRFGLLAGGKDPVGRIRVKGFELGMEARQMLYPGCASAAGKVVAGLCAVLPTHSLRLHCSVTG